MKNYTFKFVCCLGLFEEEHTAPARPAQARVAAKGFNGVVVGRRKRSAAVAHIHWVVVFAVTPFICNFL